MVTTDSWPGTSWLRNVTMTHRFLVRHGAIRKGAFSDLRRVLWCGEAMPTPTLMALMELLPHARFTNLYGPTEAIIASSFHTLVERPRSASEPIPIGLKCGGEEVWLLDDDLTETAPGEGGQIHSGGVGLSPGSWRDQARTSDAFVPHHFDATPGARGYRIELGEIEMAVPVLRRNGLRSVASVPATSSTGSAVIECCSTAWLVTTFGLCRGRPVNALAHPHARWSRDLLHRARAATAIALADRGIPGHFAVPVPVATLTRPTALVEVGHDQSHRRWRHPIR